MSRFAPCHDVAGAGSLLMNVRWASSKDRTSGSEKLPCLAKGVSFG